MSIVVVLTAIAVAALLAFLPALRSSRAWSATVTPLASIMGSGFLVSAPLVGAVVGVWAPLAMLALLVVAYGIGAMIRFNIRYAEPLVGSSDADEHKNHRAHQDGSEGTWALAEERLTVSLEKLSHVVLAGAYVVSVTYYLQLLSAFVLDRFGVSDAFMSRVLTTAVLVVITLVGARWGLKALEKVETYAVSLNLGTIAALLVGLVAHDAGLALGGELRLPDLPPSDDPVHAARVVMGLLIVVQGFETSRFLGAEHPAEERVKTMRVAQLLAAAIYVVFVTLMLPLLTPSMEAEVTEIVRLVSPVAAVLPFLIVVAAVGSQFSASVADDAGCAGLVATIVSSRLSPRQVYLLIGASAVALTWLTDVMAIISIASRAFALFYALQAGVTAATAFERDDVPRRGLWIAGGVTFAMIALSVTVFGVPAE